MKTFKLRNNYVIQYIDEWMTLPENIALIEEQLRIERIALLDEIHMLRAELHEHTSHNNIKPWEQRVDEIYEKLYSYRMGYCSRMKKKYSLFLPYSYRRRIRSLFL
ncbi:hypothetical protein [Klebsiella aerogenes]|uniref:hypothetical protein n=1 Tax=Klebsiella aerogenes TaxID=548 RepID=UPI001F48976D|nr:hypothetical protein [Klebsiella aerogenes]